MALMLMVSMIISMLSGIRPVFASTVLNTINTVTEQKSEAPTGSETLAPENTKGAAETEAAGPWITTDKQDYFPGSIVTLTGGGWTGDAQVEITVKESPEYEGSWTYKDTAQVAEDGTIRVEFTLPDWYIPQYTVDAVGLTTGVSSVTSFTDSGGAYILDFKAYNPDVYDFKLPIDYPTPPSGSAISPMPGADGTYYSGKEGLVESLEPRNLALGQIVPYEVKITVKGSTAPEDGVIRFTGLWDTLTTNKSNFGFDPSYKVFAAFVDAGDKRNVDGEKDASASIIENIISGSNIQGTIQVSGLDNGDTIIVEIWVVLKSMLPVDGINGNVQSCIDSAYTAKNDAISVGKQTVPLNKPDEFLTVETDVSITKSDEPDPMYSDNNLTYSIKVSNGDTKVAANGIVVTDILDPNVTFVSCTGGGMLAGNTITWPAFALEPCKIREFTVIVNVNSTAPTDNFPGVSAHAGGNIPSRLPNADISNIVSFTMITKDTNNTNNVWQEPTNLLPKCILAAHKEWIGGPLEDHIKVTLILYRQEEESGGWEMVEGVVPEVTPSTTYADAFDYVWRGLEAYSPTGLKYNYKVEEIEKFTNYSTVIRDMIVKNIYKPSLVIYKHYGDTPLAGAEFQLYKGNNLGIIGNPLSTLLTDASGNATFTHLEDGIYWLVESKAPSGYKYVDDIGPFEVANGTIIGPEGFATSKSDRTGDYTVSIEDEPVRELPATGGMGTIPHMAAGFALLLLAIALKAGQTGRSSKHNNIV